MRGWAGQASGFPSIVSFASLFVSPIRSPLRRSPTCLATTTATLGSCTLPPGTTDSLTSIGNIVNLAGDNGNASIGTFTNTLNASFTPAANGVPEPATYALFAAGLAAIYRLRRR